MDIFNFFSVIIAIFLLSYLPGRAVAGFLKIDEKEKLAISFGLTFLIYYIVGFSGFIFKLNVSQLHLSAVAFLLIISAILLIKNKSIHNNEFYLLLLFFCLFLVIASIQGLLPYYSGSLWYFDWYEHFARSSFFLFREPLTTHFGPYYLTARPPLFNIITSFFQSLFGADFWVFQIISTLLNSLVLLPCYLITRKALKKKEGIVFLLIMSVFLLNPSFIIQTTFTWTKLLSVYYLLLGFYFYLKFRKGRPDVYLLLGSVFLATSYITHYSSIPFILGILFDFIMQTLFAPKFFLKRLGVFLCIMVFIITSWYSWAILNYGSYLTFLGNTSYEWQKTISFQERFLKDLSTVKTTFLPIISSEYIKLVAVQKNPAVILYDLSYGFYATTIPGMITITFTILLFLYFIPKLLKLRLPNKINLRNTVKNPLFVWICFLAFGVILGTVTTPKKELLGSAHVSFIPIGILLSCLSLIIIVNYLKQRFLLFLLISGIFIEAMLGINLRIYSLRYDANPKYLFDNGKIRQLELLIPVHNDNYLLKSNNNLIFLSDKFSSLKYLFIIIIAVGELSALTILIYNFYPKKSVSLL